MNTQTAKNNIKTTMNEIYRLKPKDLYLNDINKNNTNIPNPKYSSKHYLTINLDKTVKEKDSVLIPSIYQTIKSENDKINLSNHSKTNSRNNFIITINELNNNSNSKTSYLTPKIVYKSKNLLKDNEHFCVNNTKPNIERKKLKTSSSNRCFTENMHNINNNRIIIATYQGLFDEYKLNKNKFFTNSNSIKKMNTINNDKNLGENKKNKISHKINNNFIRKNLTGAKQSSKNNSRIKLKIENDIEVQKIKENNNRKNRCIINNDGYNINNTHMNKSVNSSTKSKNIYNIKISTNNYNRNQKQLVKSDSKQSGFFANKGMNILNQIIKKRKYNIWKYIKYKITNSKYFHNNIFNVQSISYNNFQIRNNFIKEQLLNDINNKNENILKNCIKHGNNIFNTKRNEVFYSPRRNKNENLKLNISNNNSDSENFKLKSKLKKFYLKYLIEKKSHTNNIRLQKSFYNINKKNSIINYNENRKKYLLKKIISRINLTKNHILKNYFIKFYFRCKLSNHKRQFFCFKDFQDEFILMQNLYQLFYQKEKYNALIMKKYFDKFRFNTQLKNRALSKTNDYIKRNRKLKLIIINIINHNNIIIKNILKQWFLRTKMIKLIPNNQISNENKNIIQKEDLIKGINKLNDIFNIYQNKDKEENEENINKEKENSINKLYNDKYLIDSIIEEKEEEDQTEE